MIATCTVKKTPALTVDDARRMMDATARQTYRPAVVICLAFTERPDDYEGRFEIRPRPDRQAAPTGLIRRALRAISRLD